MYNYSVSLFKIKDDKKMERFERIPDIFASMVFSEDVMRERLPKDVYKSLLNTIATGKEIDASIADVVAGAMKDWAIEHGPVRAENWTEIHHTGQNG